MYKRNSILLVLALVILSVALAACSAAFASANDDDGPVGGELPPVAAVKAREVLAANLGVDLSEVIIVSQEQVTWTDSCLGLGGPAESCMRIDTPGWKVMLEVNGETYEARTDELGEQVRIAP